MQNGGPVSFQLNFYLVEEAPRCVESLHLILSTRAWTTWLNTLCKDLLSHNFAPAIPSSEMRPSVVFELLRNRRNCPSLICSYCQDEIALLGDL